MQMTFEQKKERNSMVRFFFQAFLANILCVNYEHTRSWLNLLPSVFLEPVYLK